jgi:hypothetical protein
MKGKHEYGPLGIAIAAQELGIVIVRRTPGEAFSPFVSEHGHRQRAACRQ